MEIPNPLPSDALLAQSRDLVLVDIDEMAKQLGISKSSLRRLALAGDVPCVRITDRLVRFDPIDVIATLKKD